MNRPYARGRRRSFATRGHDLRERAREVHSISFRVAGADRDEAVAEAKRQAKAEGWTIRTLSTCRPALDAGLWVVTFAAVA